MVNEVIIIGSGPAGLTAGVYLGRFKRNPLIIDGDMPGGQLMATSAVENWPGIVSIDGPDLIKNIRNHASSVGCSFLQDSVINLNCSKDIFIVKTKNNNSLKAKSIIIATGASPRKMGVPGEKEYWGRGVNICATCDAPLYEGKEVVVVGGGNSAIAESDALSKFAKKVTLIQISDKLTATDPLVDKVLSHKNIEVLYHQKVIEIRGDSNIVSEVVLENQQDKSLSDFRTDGVFVAIGMVPNSSLFNNILEIDDRGYIIIKSGCQTSINGVFAAGDISDHKYRQAITASGQGCAAALECERFLSSV